MKKYLKFIFLFTISLLITNKVFAASDIELPYSGGSTLTDIATIDPDLINSLVPAAVDVGGNPDSDPNSKLQFNGSWLDGTGARKTKFVIAEPGETRFSDIVWKYIGDKYTAKLTLKRTYNTSTKTSSAFAVVLGTNTSGVYMNHGGAIDGLIEVKYNDSDGKRKTISGTSKTFAEFSVELYKKDTNEIISLRKCYYKFMDIDAGASFRISGVKLLPEEGKKSNTLFIETTKNWPTKTKVVAGDKGDIIYTASGWNAEEKDNIDAYVKIEDATKSATLVYGYYGGAAGVGFGIYILPVKVNFMSDEHGTIMQNDDLGTYENGKLTEELIEETSPFLVEETSNPGYSFSYWIADKDVTLESGNKITALKPITGSEIEKVIVDEATSDVTFTAIHEQKNVKYASDEHGSIKGKEVEYNIENPTSTEIEANPGYYFSHWTANKNVTLTTGKKIAKGSPITESELKQVIVDDVTSGITFTAIHNPKIVNYRSDDYGRITGVLSERGIDKPSSTTEVPNDGYLFSHWVADKDAILESGKKIAKGSPITESELKEVIVDKKTSGITFTAVHELGYKVTYKIEEDGIFGIPPIVSETSVIDSNKYRNGDTIIIKPIPTTPCEYAIYNNERIDGAWQFIPWSNKELGIGEGTESFQITKNAVLKGTWKFSPNIILKIYKRDVDERNAGENNIIAGVKYMIGNKKDAEGNVIGTEKISDSDGLLYESLVTPGDIYYYQEIEAPSGYKVDNTVRSIKITENKFKYTINTYNVKEKEYGIVITKEDQFANGITGVKFKYAYGSKENLKGELGNIESGYFIATTHENDGTFGIAINESLILKGINIIYYQEIYDENIHDDYEIGKLIYNDQIYEYKFDFTPIQRFKLFKKYNTNNTYSSVEECINDIHDNWGNMGYSTESEANDYYKCDMFTVEGTNNQGKIAYLPAIINHRNIAHELNIFKKSEDTNKGLSNVKFDLYSALYDKNSKKYTLKTKIKSLITDEEGYISEKKLTRGYYCVVETETQEGYELDKTPTCFTLDDDNQKVSLTITNKRIAEVENPKTGPLNTLLIIVTSMAAACGIYAYTREKKRFI